MVHSLILISLLGTYSPGSYGVAGRLYDASSLGVEVKDQWYQIDGMSLVGLAVGVSGGNDGVWPTSGMDKAYLVSGLVNVVKFGVPQISITFEFCITINGSCTSPPVRLALISTSLYTVVFGTLVRRLNHDEKVGIAVRNITNTDDIVIWMGSISILRANK